MFGASYSYSTKSNGIESLFSSSSSSSTSAGVWVIISIILAIVGGILVHYLFVKKDTEPKNAFLKWLKDFLAFKIMWIEGLLKVIYYMATIFFMLFSFVFIAEDFLTFLCFLILIPVALRIVYEAAIMFIMIWRNTKEIAKNTKK